MKVTEKMVRAAHRAFHIVWWELPLGSACSDICGKNLDAAIRVALRAAIKEGLKREK